MKFRAIGAATVAAGLLLPGAASAAAPKPVCLQLVDDAGDGRAVAGAPSQDSLDILSADIASGKKNLVVALRLKSVALDPVLVGGVTYTFGFSAGGIGHKLHYRVYAGGEKEATMSAGDSLSEVPVGGVVDPTTSTITWTVPRKAVPGLKKPGTKVGSLAAASAVANNVKTGSGGTRGSFGADSATTGRTYTDGAPTCLRGV